MDLPAALVAFGPWGRFVSRGGPTASHAHISSPLLVCLIQKGTRTGPRNPMMCSCTSSLCPTCTGAARSLPTSGGPMLLLAAFFLHRSSANTGAGHRIEAILQASTKAASSVVSTCTSIHSVLSKHKVVVVKILVKFTSVPRPLLIFLPLALRMIRRRSGGCVTEAGFLAALQLRVVRTAVRAGHEQRGRV